MKSRISHISLEVNAGKVRKLEELHAVYRVYVQACVDLMVSTKRTDLNPSERRLFFSSIETPLSSQIAKNAQAHAVYLVNTWARALYARKLRNHIRQLDLTDEQRIKLRTIGKHALQHGGKFGKGIIPQELVDLYYTWVWDVELSGNPPKTSSRLPMMMTEMTVTFGEAKRANHHGGWWLGFSSLQNGARRVQVPISKTPYLKDPTKFAKSILVRKDRKDRWVFQFTDKSPVGVMSGEIGKVGVDVGLNVMAATSDGRRYGESLKKKFVRLYERIKGIRGNRQRQGLKGNSKRLNVLESRLSGLVKSAAGRVTNQLIKDHPNHTFVVEDLDLSGCRGQKRFAYRAVQQSLERKATVEKVNPAYTSQTCPSCGYVSKKNRYSTKFECRSCGKKIHADVVGACNLLRRSEDKQITLKTPLYQVKELIQYRYREKRDRWLALKEALAPSSLKLTARSRSRKRSASNIVSNLIHLPK
jgi:predicted RNA-binding Zn-ribbon protein involved in translation (DUF1610 family)